MGYFVVILLIVCLSFCEQAFSFHVGKFRSSFLQSSKLQAVIDLEPGKFDDVVTKSNMPVLVDFYAEWCGPCKIAGPIFSQLSEEMQDIKFVKVDTEAHEDTVDRFNIQGLPLFGLFINGNMIANHAGALNKELLKDFVQKGLKDSQIA